MTTASANSLSIDSWRSSASPHEPSATLLDAIHPGVSWSDIIGLRVVLAHHYHRVDPNQVWTIASTEVPKLVEQLS